MRKTRLFIVCCVLLVVPSCATTFGGLRYQAQAYIDVEERPKADIYLNNTMLEINGRTSVKQRRNNSVCIKVGKWNCKVSISYMIELRAGRLLSVVFIALNKINNLRY